MILFFLAILALPLYMLVGTVVHELGHAIAGLLLYKEKVQLFIGPNGNANSKQFQLGRLQINFAPSVFNWYQGLCIIPDGTNNSMLRAAVYTAAGPVASILGFIVCLMLFLDRDAADVVREISFFSTIIFALGIVNSLRISAVPSGDSKNPVYYSDGALLLHIAKYRRNYSHILTMYNLLVAKDYEKGLQYFSTIPRIVPECHWYALGMYVDLKRWTEAEMLVETCEQFSHIPWENYLQLADYYYRRNQFDRAIFYCDKILEMDAENNFGLNNKGYYLLLAGHYEAALAVLELVKNGDTQMMGYATNNMAYAKIKLGRLEEAWLDLKTSEDYMPENPYLIRNHGIYYQTRGEVDKARELYLQAQAMDPEMDEIDELLKSIK